MELVTIETGTVKFDGGSMFGIIPRVIWQELYPPDKRHYCHFAMRSLLCIDGDRKILIDTGIGSKQSKSFLKYYTEQTEHSLTKSLFAAGFEPESITDVVLTHLHFDHCGGSVNYNELHEPVPAFPNATYHTSIRQWEWAMNPNERESPSYLKENFVPLEASGQLKFIEHEQELFPGFYVKLFDGHTSGQVIPYISKENKTVVFCADLFPTSLHLQMPCIMAYDTRPLQTIEDKKRFMNEIDPDSTILFFGHDLYTECCTIKTGQKGLQVDQSFKIADLK